MPKLSNGIGGGAGKGGPPGKDCSDIPMKLAAAFHRITRLRRIGMRNGPIKASPWASTVLPDYTETGLACIETTAKRQSGIASPQKRGTSGPRESWRNFT